MKTTPTIKQTTSLEEAFNILNKELFNSTLPPVFITFQRRKKALGYYWHEQLTSRTSDKRISEIALNVATFHKRTDAQILSTLAHEMAHHWQSTHGTPSRSGYHNEEWAKKMEEIGLMPSHTGQKGGNRTGQSMTHYIIDGGKFDLTCKQLKKAGVKIHWNSVEPTKAAQNRNKVKFCCPMCDQKAWGKPDLSIDCGECNEHMQANV